MIRKLINYFLQKDRFKKVIIVEPGQSIEIPSKTLVLTKKGNMFTWVRYKCPCGCGVTIRLSLNPVIEPYWSIVIPQDKRKKSLVTITPSVYMRSTKCCSHYFITHNRVIWCK